MDKKEVRKDIEKKMKAYKKAQKEGFTPVSYNEMLKEIADYAGVPNELRNKYELNVYGKNVYYEWTKANNQLLSEEYNWSGLFTLPKPITLEGFEGFASSHFNFIKLRIKSPEHFQKEYENSLSLFDLKPNDNLKPKILVNIVNYRDTLLNQILKQAERIELYNQRIVNVLKVYYYETEQAFKLALKKITGEENRIKLRKEYLDTHFKIANIFQIDIINGLHSEEIQERLTDLNQNPFLSNHLIESTKFGIIKLAEEREPYIKIAEKLALMIKPLEAIFENSILDNKILSAHEATLKQMPIPAEVAKDFYDRKENKAGEYKPELLVKAFEAIKTDIIEHNLSSLKGKKRTISKKVKETIQELNTTDLKTIDRWVEYYWEKYDPSNRRK